MTSTLASRTTMASSPPASPARYTGLVPYRRDNEPANRDVPTAVTTWGRNMVPYCELDSAYSAGFVNIVLAAGIVTSTMPWTAPAA
jgi:hypothetical protein